MITVISNGGLGDAVYRIAKLYSDECPFPVDLKKLHLIHLANRRGPQSFLDSISGFYSMQGISNTIELIGMGEDSKWANNNCDKFQYWVQCGWGNVRDPATYGMADVNDNWRINPFPPLVFDQRNTDIVISPYAGWNTHRGSNLEDLVSFVESVPEDRSITYAGWAPEDYIRSVQRLRGECLLGMTTIEEMVSLVLSANIVLSNAGFVSYLAAMGGVKVFSIIESRALCDWYFHPDWNLTEIEHMSDVTNLMGEL